MLWQEESRMWKRQFSAVVVVQCVVLRNWPPPQKYFRNSNNYTLTLAPTYCTTYIAHCNRIPVLAKMPNNRRITKKTIKGKEGLHPGSRKAAQLTRVQLRVEKLKGNNKARKDHVAARGTSPNRELNVLTY